MPDRVRKLQYLGVFFHYQQDSWAHRVHQNSDATNFTPYFQPLGHFVMGHQPDRPPFDPVCALRCLEEGIGYVRTFMTRALGGTPNATFDNYSPAAGVVDEGWRGKGKFVHQLVVDPSSSGHRFVTSLIRAQVGAYTNGLELGNPSFAGFYTSNEAVYGTMRSALTGACSSNGIPVNIPDEFIPLSTLTTPIILSGAQLPVPVKGQLTKVIKIQSAATGQFVCASDGLADNQWLYCKAGAPVQFTVVGPLNNCVLKVVGQSLYFSYNATTGAVKLWSTPDGANFSLDRQANGTYTMRSLKYNQYVWLSGASPYITSSGKPANSNAQWTISGL